MSGNVPPLRQPKLNAIDQILSQLLEPQRLMLAPAGRSLGRGVPGLGGTGNDPRVKKFRKCRAVRLSGTVYAAVQTRS